jgi:ABC-type antimicrobial peptide transport system permease subunit
VAADAGFLAAINKKPGDVFPLTLNSQTFFATVTGTFELFPGFDPTKGQHLIVADLQRLQDIATRTPTGNANLFANEAWLAGRTLGDVTPALVASRGVTAEGVLDREVVKRNQSTDPLIAASWEGILFLSFSSVLLLSTICFITYAALSAQARSLEFAILRTMGFSGRQILGIVSFEQWFVIGAGVAAGTVLGFPLARLMIDYLGIDEQGHAALPPLISRVGWETVLTVYVVLGIVVAATIAGLVALYARLAVSRALRMGEL